MRFARRIKSWMAEFETSFWDHLLGIDTFGCRDGARPEGALQSDAAQYQSKCYYLIWRYLQPVKMAEDDVFYDVGCGAGRILCCASLRKPRRCVGIELSHELCELARDNARRMRFQRAPIEIREADAARAAYSEGTVFSFFNPFGRDTLRMVLDSIREDVARRPRRVRFIYIHPVAQEAFAENHWLHRTAECQFLGSALRIFYYENTDSPRLPARCVPRTQYSISDNSQIQVLDPHHPRLPQIPVTEITSKHK
jgi:SAM-dependent methyltransferase